MIRGFGLGIGSGIDGNKAARMAVQEALSHMGTGRPVFGIVFVSQEFDSTEVLTAVASYLGGTPIWGCTASTLFSQAGIQSRSVMVGVFSGRDLIAEVDWLESIDAKRMNDKDLRSVLMIGSGLDFNQGQIIPLLSNIQIPVAGCLASGGYLSGKTNQVVGNQSSNSKTAAALLKGRWQIGIGFGSGWQASGISYKISKAGGCKIEVLDQSSAADAFSKTLGIPVSQWFELPLKEISRMYALGIEVFPGSSDMIYRSPLWFDADGSLRGNLPVPEGQTAHLLLGNQNQCLEAVNISLAACLKQMHQARPMFAILFLDLAWKFLFQTNQNLIIDSIQKSLKDIPWIGIYTLGQISRSAESTVVQMENQGILSVVLGETN